MTKIAHVADAHWGLNYAGPHPAARFEDICRTMDWVADRIIEEDCDFVLYAGDAFKDARVFIDRASIEIAAFASWIRKITGKGIEVIVISGTPSHDAIAAYEIIKEMNIPLTRIFTKPDVARVGDIAIACLPGMNRSNIVTQEEYRGLPPHEIHRIMTEKIYETSERLAAGCGNGPKILMSHLTFDLADTGFEDALLQNEPILTEEATDLFDIVCLGHIHRPQQAGRNVFYSGAPERHNFGDEKVGTGFWIHEYDGADWTSRHIETPARRFLTYKWDEEHTEDWLSEYAADFEGAKDAIIRIHIQCDQEQNKRLDRNALEKVLYEAGAFFVAEIRVDVEKTERTRDQEVTGTIGPIQAVRKWGENQEIDPVEIAELQHITEELLKEVVV